MAIHINEGIKKYLESIGGGQCQICSEWSDSDTFVGPICQECNIEIEEVIAEADDW